MSSYKPSTAQPVATNKQAQLSGIAHELLDGYRIAVYTCVPLSSSTDGGNLRCFSSMVPLGALCRRIRCTCHGQEISSVKAPRQGLERPRQRMFLPGKLNHRQALRTRRA